MNKVHGERGVKKTDVPHVRVVASLALHHLHKNDRQRWGVQSQKGARVIGASVLF